MIIPIGKDTAIPEGKFVCAGSGLIDGICTYPRKVTRVSGQRIYFIREEGDREEYMARHRAAYLCDTAEEGKALCDLGLERIKATNKAIDEARKQVRAEFSGRIGALMKGTTT